MSGHFENAHGQAQPESAVFVCLMSCLLPEELPSDFFLFWCERSSTGLKNIFFERWKLES